MIQKKAPDERIPGASCECGHARLCHTDISESRQICAHCSCVEFKWYEGAAMAGITDSLPTETFGASTVGRSVNTGGAHPAAYALDVEFRPNCRGLSLLGKVA